MGAKTALLAYTGTDLRKVLRGAGPPDPAAAEALVRRTFPGYVVTADDDTDLAGGAYPPDDVTCATALPGADLLCDRRLVLGRPSELPGHLRAPGAGRRIVMHGMHAVVDWLCFAVWEDGTLVRSLSLSPDGGIEENIGEPYAFERPYWDGANPVEVDPDEDPYPLPFHPLELGEEALDALFGFVLEGRPDPDHIDAGAIRLARFRVTDPSGAEQAVQRR